jgi:hypothetical protein
MNRLTSRRHHGRFLPKVEALEDRSLLTATVAGTNIITTGAVNKLLITDDGTTIRVFTDNSPGSPPITFAEGTPLTVRTNKAGSTNLVTYYVLGSNSPASTTVINANLTVEFGKGNGQLSAGVLAGLPTSMNGPILLLAQASLTDFSNLNVTAKSEGGNTNASLFVAGIGTDANLQFNDSGTGKGSNTFSANLGGAEQAAGSTVGLTFNGGDGANSATVMDKEDMDAGSTTAIDLRGKKGTDSFTVQYQGKLNGNLTATATGGSGNDTIVMDFELKAGSNSGSLTSAENGGKGNDKLTDVVHKLSGDTTTVTETADGGKDGPLAKSKDKGSFTQTTATAVGIVFSDFLPANVTFVP